MAFSSAFHKVAEVEGIPAEAKPLAKLIMPSQ